MDLDPFPLVDQPCNGPAPSSPTTPTPLAMAVGASLVGRSVRKKFDLGWYNGKVTRFDARSHLYQVVYSDSDSEVMPYSKLATIIADERFVGRAVRREFSQGWFEGTITAFDPSSNLYEIKYSDGDSENMSLASMSDIIVGQPGEPDAAPTSGPQVDNGCVVTRQDAPHVTEESEHSTSTSLAFDVVIPTADDNIPSDQEPEDVIPAVAIPATVLSLHAALLEEFAIETGVLAMPIHETYLLSGVMIPYAVPTYTKPTHPSAMIEWLETQNVEDEFKDACELTDNNCKLDFGEWVLRCQISHRNFQHLRQLVKKWMPVETVFPPTEDGEPHGKDSPAAFLVRLVQTRKGLEEYLDKRIAAHNQARLPTPP